MNKTALAFCMLLLLLVGAFHFSDQSTGNPSINPQVPSIQITSPPYPSREFETSTVNLEIYVNMYNDSPKLTSISYSLDDGPLVNLENLSVTNIIDFGQDKIDFTLYEASHVLGRLSEGNHTVVAYSGDLSVSRAFTVKYNQPSSSSTPELTPTLKSFSTSLIIAVVILVVIGTIALIVAICAGLLVYYRKSQKGKTQ